MATDMSKEAMKLALEALEKGKYYAKTLMMSQEPFDAAIKALAEQPAQQIADSPDDWSDWKVIPPQSQPAQHEPFTHYRHYDNGLQDWADEKTIPLYTFPPAQRTWVGLTQDEFRDFASTLEYGTGGLIRAIEAKLKEKNT